MPFPVGFLHHDDVGQPFGVIDFSNEFNSQKLLYFFHNSFATLKSEDSSFMLDGLFGGIDIELVIYHFVVYVWHVFVSSGEDIQILLQELYDLAIQV